MNAQMRYPVYRSAKTTAVSELPEHWTARRLRFVCTVNPSKSKRSVPDGTLVSFIPMEAVGERGGLTLNAEKAVEDIGTGYTYFEDGDVVVAKITPCFENGKGALAEGLTSGVAYGTTELHVIRAGEALHPRFLFYVTVAGHFRNIGESEMYGAGGQKRIPDSFLKDFRIAIPSLKEQLEICDFLDRETSWIDEVERKKRAILERLEERRLAIITRAVTRGPDPSVKMQAGAPEWLGSYPAHWQVLPLVRVVKKFVDYRGATPTKTESGIPLITATQIKYGRINHSLDPVFISEEEYTERMTRGFPERGDVLVTTEAPLGESAQIEDPHVTPGQRIILMKANSSIITNDFLFAHFRSDVGRTELLCRASGSTASGIRADRLKGSKVLVPPLTEQHDIVAHIKRAAQSLEPIAAVVEKQIAVLHEYRSALITNAVTGRIDVRSHQRREAAE
jgi:type I restriction enzyme, S subunit